MSTISIFAEAIAPTVTSWPFLERWGGAAKAITVPSSYKAKDGSFVQRTTQVPVTCAASEACTPEADAFYKRLLPDDAYSSLAYIEARSNLSANSFKSASSGTASQGAAGVLSLSQTARLPVWLNLKKLGSEALSCGAVASMALYALTSLQGKSFAVDVEWANTPLRAVVQDISIMPDDVAQVFAPYDYAVNNRVFLHPYGFFGLYINFAILVPPRCICLPAYEEINCITSW